MVRLLPFTPAHFPLLLSWVNSERELVQWAGPTLTYPLDEAQLASMLDLANSHPPQRLFWMAADNDQIVGHVQLALDWRNGNATLSRVAIAPDARGRKLAVPMLKLAIAEAFSIDGIERVELNVYTFNLPALRAYSSLGFIQEGVRRSSTKVGRDRWDTVIMGLLRTEWSSTAC
jgi:RimJ/RimL family protein N-acetyltransferase